jgi:hypothetical protein
MGYMDFDKTRYFDARELSSIYQPLVPLEQDSLPSDSSRRADSSTLKLGDVENA